MALSNDPKIELIEESKKSYKIEINGNKDKMSKNNFQELVLKKLDSIETRLDDIDTRLNVLENKVDLMMETPTMKQELSSLLKNKK